MRPLSSAKTGVENKTAAIMSGRYIEMSFQKHEIETYVTCLTSVMAFSVD
jgi:hypothetical protein